MASLIWESLVSIGGRLRENVMDNRFALLFIGASLSEPHLVRGVAGSANTVCIKSGLSVWATG